MNNKAMIKYFSAAIAASTALWAYPASADDDRIRLNGSMEGAEIESLTRSDDRFDDRSDDSPDRDRVNSRDRTRDDSPDGIPVVSGNGPAPAITTRPANGGNSKVPEPLTSALLGLGLGSIALSRLRRKNG